MEGHSLDGSTLVNLEAGEEFDVVGEVFDAAFKEKLGIVHRLSGIRRSVRRGTRDR